MVQNLGLVTPTEAEKDRLARKHNLIVSLGHLPKFTVRMGKLVVLGENREGRRIFYRKQLDCMMAGPGVEAMSGRIDSVALFCTDEEIVPAVKAVKDVGVTVRLWHGTSPRTFASTDLINLADEHRHLNQDILNRIQKNGARVPATQPRHQGHLA